MTDRGAHLRVHLAIALVVAAALSVMSPAAALPLEEPVYPTADARVARGGPCSGPSKWRIGVSRVSPSKLRVRYHVEGGKAGQTWNVFISDNGTRIFSDSRVSGSNGVIDVIKRTGDRAGSDAIAAAANNLATGERCSGRATF